MHCSVARELLSADLDGELTEGEERLLIEHLARCADCTGHAARAAALHRSLRVQPAPPMPDLTEAILARLAAEQEVAAGSGAGSSARRRSGVAWRIGLAVVGIIQLVLAGPALIVHADFSDDLHALHHLNAWAVAFAVGLLVVAVQPWRVRGVLPIATALAAVMVFTVVLDIRNEHAIGMPATAHLLELAGLLLAWGLARQQRRSGDGEPAGGGRGRARWRRGDGDVSTRTTDGGLFAGATLPWPWSGRQPQRRADPPAPAARPDRAA
jgi:predicted anti-sigma-YlaC factor YlaD